MLTESQLILRLLDTFAFLLSKAYPLCICKQMEILIKFNILKKKKKKKSVSENAQKQSILLELRFNAESSTG